MASKMIQKITTFNIKSKFIALGIINDKRYRSILRVIYASLDKLNNEDFLDTIWAISLIHKDEGGILYFNLF